MGVKIGDDFTGGAPRGKHEPMTEDEWNAAFQEEVRRTSGFPRNPIPPDDIACSFCGKPQRLVKRLVQGNGSYMCDECVAASAKIMANGDEPGRELQVVRASDIGMEATEWLWEDEDDQWLPTRAVALIAGRAGVGKSTVVADLVARITNGTLPGEYFGHPKAVIVVATEDSWKQTINPRLVAAGADLSLVLQVNAVTAEGMDTLQLPEDIERVRHVVEVYDVALIVLDPLMSALSKKLDSHKDAEVRRGLEPLSRLAHTANLSVIGLIHENKSSASDLLSRIMGSRAFTAVVRAVLYAARYEPDPDDESEPVDELGMPTTRRPDEFVFGQSKSNLGRLIKHSIRYTIQGVDVGWDEYKNKIIKSSRIVWGETEDQTVQDIVKAQESVKRDAKVSEAKKWLKDYLTGPKVKRL
jgi:RecA-family ATPase